MTLASGRTSGHQAVLHRLARYRGGFPIFRGRIYLNTCSLRALGERPARKDQEVLAGWGTRGAARGVELVVVESLDHVSVPVEAIARAVDERTALVATSHVYFTSGAIQDIRAVAHVAHARGALCLVDAYQSVGQVPCDVRAADVDFLTAGGLKWLLGGPGIVFLYVRDELARRLEPGIAGWFGHKHQFAFEPRSLERHDDARRFELG